MDTTDHNGWSQPAIIELSRAKVRPLPPFQKWISNFSSLCRWALLQAGAVCLQRRPVLGMLFLAAWLSAHCRRAAPAVARRASDVPASEMLCVCACLAGGLTEQLSSNSTRYWTASPGSRTSAAHTHAHTATHTHTHTHTHTQTHNIQ